LQRGFTRIYCLFKFLALRPSYGIGRWQQSSKFFCSSSLQILLFKLPPAVSCPLYVCQEILGDSWCWFPECVTNPPPSSDLITSIQCVFSHKSLLLTVFGQQIWRLLLRQLLIKVCTFLMVALVVLHVSAPYCRTDFMLELNRHIFVCNGNTLELQMFLSCINALLALPNLPLTSASVPPCLSMILPRYMKVSTSSISFLSSLTGSVLTAFTLRIFVLHLWVF